MTLDAEELEDNLSMFDDWSERYQYIIDLGKKLEPYPEDVRDDDHKVRGCMSQVWLTHQLNSGDAGPTLHFQGDSDAMIVRGLIAILVALISGQTVQDIRDTDIRAELARLDLDQALSSQRSNGLRAMVARIEDIARGAKAA